MKKNEWQNDPEYMSYVGELLQTPEVQRLADFKQHYFSNRLEHSIAVSFDSYRIAKIAFERSFHSKSWVVA